MTTIDEIHEKLIDHMLEDKAIQERLLAQMEANERLLAELDKKLGKVTSWRDQMLGGWHVMLIGVAIIGAVGAGVMKLLGFVASYLVH